jgi:gas vesicle protein
MSKTGSAIASFIFGAAVGVAVGYVLATDKETRQEDMAKLKKSLNALKGKLESKPNSVDLEEEIYHS